MPYSFWASKVLVTQASARVPRTSIGARVRDDGVAIVASIVSCVRVAPSRSRPSRSSRPGVDFERRRVGWRNAREVRGKNAGETRAAEMMGVPLYPDDLLEVRGPPKPAPDPPALAHSERPSIEHDSSRPAFFSRRLAPRGVTCASSPARTTSRSRSRPSSARSSSSSLSSPSPRSCGPATRR